MAIPKNDEEILALEQFRDKIEDLGFPDGVLMRFLRARDLDHEKAEDMLRKFIIWRVESDCNKFLNWIPPKELFNYDIYLTGYDLEGRAVFWAPYGFWPYVRPLLDKGMDADLLLFAGSVMDKVYNLLLKTKHQQFIAIVDSDGVTLRKILYEAGNWRGFTMLMKLLSDYEANFPELLHKAFMIQTPLAFMWGWKWIAPFLSDYTISKVNFYGSSSTHRQKWKADLFENLPGNVIPEKYGGTATLTLVTDLLK